MVLETHGWHQPQHLNVRVTCGLIDGAIHVWETNATKEFLHVADLQPRHGELSYTFDPDSLYSLTTTTGQRKGTAAPPPDKPFPFPYKDSFETTPLEKSPKYLSDQDGAFEVHPCLYRSGKCLQQVITAKPIPWAGLPDPWTLAGDEQWKDYRMAADVLISDTGPLTLMGRIDSAKIFENRHGLYPSGYIFSILHDGGWKLLSAKEGSPVELLASGEIAFSTLKWHHVELDFHGSVITVALDGKQIARVTDHAHTHGMIGLGTGWDTGEFDNLSVSAD